MLVQSGYLFPKCTYFQIFYSNHAIDALISKQSLLIDASYRRFNLENINCKNQLMYVTCIAYISRLMKCAFPYGYYPSIPNALELLQAPNILLPKYLADYIESIGLVELNNLAKTIPWIGSREELFAENLGQISPKNILSEAKRTIPDNYWWIDEEWIKEWNDIANKLNEYNCRYVNNNDINGKREALVTPIIKNGLYKATAPQTMSEHEAILGTIYEWRNFDQKDSWPGQTNIICLPIFNSMEFDPQQMWQYIILQPLLSYIQNN